MPVINVEIFPSVEVMEIFSNSNELPSPLPLLKLHINEVSKIVMNER